MRRFSKLVMGLLIGATAGLPIAAQAQDRDQDRGGQGRAGWQRGADGGNSGWQRGGGERPASQRGDGGASGGGWQRGGSRSAVVDEPARREAIEQGRQAQRQVERPIPSQPVQPALPTEPARRAWQNGDAGNTRGDRTGGDRWQRAGGGGRDGMTVGTRDRANRWDRDGDRRADRTDGWRGAAGQDGRNWQDRRDGTRDGDRDRAERRDSDWRRRQGWDGNRSWSTDRRDWDRNDRRWDRDWRSDRRYSWQDYRSSHRSIYRQPRYQDRHGYSYRRWSPGYRWDPWFYSSTFWISDPWYYRLPPVDGPYRWVRYYDDVVLVDIETGEIVDIIYSFFW